MPRGTHKNSIQNLTHEGRPPDYDEPKTGHRVTVTQTGWLGAKKLIGSMDMSVSEFLEKLGRGEIVVMQSQELESIEDTIDSVLLRQAIAQTNNAFMSVDEVLLEQGVELAELDG
jgi:hypothetical protein